MYNSKCLEHPAAAGGSQVRVLFGVQIPVTFVFHALVKKCSTLPNNPFTAAPGRESIAGLLAFCTWHWAGNWILFANVCGKRLRILESVVGSVRVEWKEPRLQSRLSLQNLASRHPLCRGRCGIIPILVWRSKKWFDLLLKRCHAMNSVLRWTVLSTISWGSANWKGIWRSVIATPKSEKNTG